VRESMNAAAAIYAHHFTVAEMHAIVAFYKTPAGAKALKMMPTVTEEFAMATGPELLELQQKTGAAVGKFVKLLQKSKADAAPKK
jgi:uncharacterized protein